MIEFTESQCFPAAQSKPEPGHSVRLNMVRAGVVAHPREWAHGGYREIQAPRRRYVLIDYQALGQLAGFDDFGLFQEAHRHWVEAALAEQGNGREPGWTESVAVGQKDFVQRIGQWLGGMARGRSIRKADTGWELREEEATYNAHFGAENRVIGGENRRFWRLNETISER